MGATRGVGSFAGCTGAVIGWGLKLAMASAVQLLPPRVLLGSAGRGISVLNLSEDDAAHTTSSWCCHV